MIFGWTILSGNILKITSKRIRSRVALSPIWGTSGQREIYMAATTTYYFVTPKDDTAYRHSFIRPCRNYTRVYAGKMPAQTSSSFPMRIRREITASVIRSCNPWSRSCPSMAVLSGLGASISTTVIRLASPPPVIITSANRAIPPRRVRDYPSGVDSVQCSARNSLVMSYSTICVNA